MKEPNKDSLDHLAEKLADTMFKFKKICNEKEAYFAHQVGITPVEFRCLRYLEGKEYVIVKDLAKLMNLQPSRITRLISSLEEKKYVRRELDIIDRRNVRIYLNKNKQKIIDGINKKYVLLHYEILDNLSTDFVGNAVNELEEIYGIFEKWVEENVHKK